MKSKFSMFKNLNITNSIKIKNSKLKILLILLVIGGVLRFYNLNWGAPFYFHPDERNIASLISSLNSANLDFLWKGTFVYGTLVSNVLFIIKNSIAPFLVYFQLQDAFVQSIILLRILAAISSVLTITVVFLICYKRLKLEKTFLATALTTFSVGLIQAAHFGVYESVLTLIYSFLLFLLLIFWKTKKIKYIYLATLVVSLATAIKINSIILLIIPLGLLAIQSHREKIKKTKTLLIFLSLILIFGLVTIIASPYYLTSNFKNMFNYESSLLTGSLPVFYTGAFFNTTPVLYQFTHILPFLINPLLTIGLIISLPYVLYRGIKKKNILYLLILTFFLVLFLPNAFLFTKWTRYLVPMLPFVYIIIAIAIVDFFDSLPKKIHGLKSGVLVIIIFTSVVFAFAYTRTALRVDTRIETSKWAFQNIPPNAKILSEVYDLGITPFNSYFPEITLFNFYELENDPSKKPELESLIERADYIILPSQRILKSRLQNKKTFPNGYEFYKKLFNDSLSFKKIYETPCDVFCKITYLGNSVFNIEETANVFDRPTLFIFEKNKENF